MEKEKINFYLEKEKYRDTQENHRQPLIIVNAFYIGELLMMFCFRNVYCLQKNQSFLAF